jgi:hypothetical protein
MCLPRRCAKKGLNLAQVRRRSRNRNIRSHALVDAHGPRPFSWSSSQVEVGVRQPWQIAFAAVHGTHTLGCVQLFCLQDAFWDTFAADCNCSKVAVSSLEEHFTVLRNAASAIVSSLGHLLVDLSRKAILKG